MTLPPGFTISAMRDNEVAQLHAWAKSEGWNPGLNDLEIARQTDPDAFVSLREGDTLAGGGSIFSYDGRFGFMGLFIMRADLRRKGLGTLLWHWRRDRLRARLLPGASIGMDGVFDMVPFYERGGFRQVHRDLRFEGVARGSDAHANVVPLDLADFDEIERFDRAFFPAPRIAFLRRWIGQSGAHVAGVRENGTLAAYGVARPCVTGFKIGPLFADRAELAGHVLSALTARIAGQQVQIDIPEPNAAATELAGRFGLKVSFGCVRLYHGEIPELPLQRIFAVTSLEFG
jgi:GNAT superfamily N-acetyltransferase